MSADVLVAGWGVQVTTAQVRERLRSAHSQVLVASLPPMRPPQIYERCSTSAAEYLCAACSKSGTANLAVSARRATVGGTSPAAAHLPHRSVFGDDIIDRCLPRRIVAPSSARYRDGVAIGRGEREG